MRPLDRGFPYLYNSTYMKRFDDCLTFSHSRHLGVKREYMSRLFEESGISKGYPLKSKMAAHHYIESLVGNLAEAFLLQRNLALRLSDPDPTPNIKNKILEGMKRLDMISDVRKGYSYKTTSLKIPKSDLTKIEPSRKILDVFDPASIVPSKAWSIIVRKGDDEILEKSCTDDHALLYRCACRFQKKVNIPIRSFRRIFNNDLESGGRIYSNYQQMSKEMRQMITIGNEKTIELDYRYNQIRMLFTLFGIDDNGDPYSGFAEDRDVVKKAMNTLINSTAPKRVFCDMRWTAPFRWSPDKADKFISEAYARYPILQDMKGSSIGLKLQKIEGDISLAIMKQALYNDSVVLPIHDSFIVRESEAHRFGYIMDETWNQIVGVSKNRHFLPL